MGDDFYLDTQNMDNVIGEIQRLADRLERLRGDFQKAITDVTQDWMGKSRTTFDKKAHMLMQQLTDVSQSLFDMGEELTNAATAYMDYDTQCAKAADGVSNRY